MVFLSSSRKLPVLHLNQTKSAILKSDGIVKGRKEVHVDDYDDDDSDDNDDGDDCNTLFLLLYAKYSQ